MDDSPAALLSAATSILNIGISTRFLYAQGEVMLLLIGESFIRPAQAKAVGPTGVSGLLTEGYDTNG